MSENTASTSVSSFVSTNSVHRGSASLDDIIFTLSVNFLMYVVLILVFYMLARFYLEEQTTAAKEKGRITKDGYTLVSTDDSSEIDLPSTSIDAINEVSSEKSGAIDIEYESPYPIPEPVMSPKIFFVSLFNGEVEDGEQSKEYISKVIVCGVGLNIVFGIWGILQERILAQTYDGDFFEYSYGLVFINRLLGLLFSAYLMYHFKVRWIKTPLWEYSIPSVANMLSSWCQYEALKYVSFPTQMLAKAFKMLPVMVVGTFIHNKHYESYEYISAALSCFGIYLFIESSEHINFNANVFGDSPGIHGALCGIVLLLLFLAFDSFTGQWQARMFQIYDHMSPLQMMLITNAFSGMFSFVTLVHQEELYLSLDFVYKHPEMYLHLILFCLCSTVGQLLIYYAVKNFGAVVFSIIMGIRILLSTILSCIIYSHPITEISFIGFLIVIASLGYRIHRKTEGHPLLKWKSKENLPALAHEWREQADV